MRHVYNLSYLKDTRRALRYDRSPAEHILWRYLRKRQLLGLKFRRQFSIGRYIFDFFCPAIKLVVEIDGDSHYHERVIKMDLVRDRYLHSLGIRIIRFRNDEVRYDTLGVIERLRQFITTPPAPPL